MCDQRSQRGTRGAGEVAEESQDTTLEATRGRG